MSKSNFQVGDKVEWEWGNGTAAGKVTEVFTERVERTIQGNEVTRNGSEECPALLIEQDDGDRVLKLASEVSKCS